MVLPPDTTPIPPVIMLLQSSTVPPPGVEQPATPSSSSSTRPISLSLTRTSPKLNASAPSFSPRSSPPRPTPLPVVRTPAPPPAPHLKPVNATSQHPAPLLKHPHQPPPQHQQPPNAQPPPLRLPKLRAEFRDLSHPGSKAFLSVINPADVLSTAIHTVSRLLLSPTPPSPLPTIRSITLILRSFPGIAHTTGSDLDPHQHKEIHLSLPYLSSIAPTLLRDEITGVLTHEMVHVFQSNGFDTAPSGLIEGIADWVRLKAGLAPGHWKRRAEGGWDGGYEGTAWFLEWLCERERKREGGKGKEVVGRVNEYLGRERYVEEKFWREVCGERVQVLWGMYREELGREKGAKEEGGK